MKRKVVTLLLSVLLVSYSLFAGGTAEPAAKGVVLKHSNWRPEDLDKWGAIYAEFMKDNPDIQLVDDPMPADRYFNNMEINAEGGQLNQLVSFWQNRVWNNNMYERGYVVNLTHALPEAAGMPEHHRYNFMTDAGELFAVPVSAQYTAILYNKKIFRENGIKIPVTWDEFIQVCETLKKKGITPLMFQTKDAWHIHYSFDSFMKGYLGGDAFIKSLLSGTYDFTNPTFVGALKRLKSLRPYFPANFTGLGYSDAQNMMATEQVAMWPGCGSWEVFTLKDINPEVELGAFANPVEKVGDKAYVTVFTDQGIALSAKASEAEKAAATRFMKWVATPKAGLLINKYLGFFNCFDNNVFDDVTMKEYAALAGSHGENIISDWAILLSDGNPTATELIQAGIQELMTDKKTAEEVAADIKKGLSIWYGK